jgi:hypothetical protein
MTAIVRDIGSIPVADLQANTIDWGWFVSVDIAAPVGMKRFCNRAVNVTDNIDGSSQTWTCGVGLEVGNIDQGREFVLNPSTMSVDNINNTWGNWANSPGLRDVPVEIYVVWYDAAGAMTGGTCSDRSSGSSRGARSGLVAFSPRYQDSLRCSRRRSCRLTAPNSTEVNAQWLNLRSGTSRTCG